MKKPRSTTKAHKAIFIRANDVKEIALIADLQKRTNSKAASQAFLKAGAIYIQQLKDIEGLNIELNKVNIQLREANLLLARLNNAQLLLTGYSKKFLSGKNIQQDLFD